MPHAKPEFRPLHIQIRDLLLQRIASSEWTDNEPLPSEIALAKEYEVSIGTIRKALDDLTANHLIVRHRGRGTFVTRHSLHEALYRWFSIVPDCGTKTFPHDEVTAKESGTANAEEAEALKIDEGGEVIRVFRLRTLDGKALMHDRLVVSAELLHPFSWPEVAGRYRTPYEYYEGVHRLKVIEVVERVKAVGADARDAEILGVAPGVPLLAITRIALTFEDQPVELRVSHLVSDSHSYVNRII